KLKKFLIDYYSTGMPSRFASEVEVTDPDTGKTFESTIEVNEPLRYKWVTVYQSSFDDGGSSVSLKGYPLVGAASTSFDLDGTLGKHADATGRRHDGSARDMQVEITALRPISVEDLSGGTPGAKRLSFGEQFASVACSAAGKKIENLRHVVSSVEYRPI